MAWKGVITNAGRTLFASGASLSISSVKTGSGSTTEENMKSATALVTQKDTGVVESKTAVSNGIQVRMRVNPAASASYTMTEMGLFITGTSGGTSTTVMAAYYIEDDGGVEIPLASSFPDFAYILSSVLVVDNSLSISLTVDPEAYVSYTYLQTALADKTDKVSSATNNHFAALDANGNLKDSGKSESDFAGTATATTSSNGLMSSQDKTILNGLNTGFTPLSRNAYTAETEVTVTLATNQKVYIVYSAASSAGTNGAIMDATYGSYIFISNGDYAVIHKGSAITVSVSNSILSVSSTTAVKMGVIEL